MKRYLETGALLSLLPGLAIGPLVAADKKVPAAKPTRPTAVQRIVPPPKAPKNINNPGANIAQRLLQMTPDQRERAIVGSAAATLHGLHQPGRAVTEAAGNEPVGLTQ